MRIFLDLHHFGDTFCIMFNVTISGADDNTNPETLIKLSKRFPFVEWGVLWSYSRAGKPRYPTRAWMYSLASHVVDAAHDVAISVHFCGQVARDVMEGMVGARLELLSFAKRVQINGFEPEKMMNRRLRQDMEFILQCPSEDRLQDFATFILDRPENKWSILFDGSAGRGIEAFRWPVPPLGVKLGYAGGINPSNVQDMMARVLESRYYAADPCSSLWIDMETGVRDQNNRFEIAKVESVLEQVEAQNKRMKK